MQRSPPESHLHVPGAPAVLPVLVRRGGVKLGIPLVSEEARTRQNHWMTSLCAQVCVQLTWGLAAGSSGSHWCSCHTESVSAFSSKLQCWSPCWPGRGGGGNSDRNGVCGRQLGFRAGQKLLTF